MNVVVKIYDVLMYYGHTLWVIICDLYATQGQN